MSSYRSVEFVPGSQVPFLGVPSTALIGISRGIGGAFGVFFLVLLCKLLEVLGTHQFPGGNDKERDAKAMSHTMECHHK